MWVSDVDQIFELPSFGKILFILFPKISVLDLRQKQKEGLILMLRWVVLLVDVFVGVENVGHAFKGVLLFLQVIENLIFALLIGVLFLQAILGFVTFALKFLNQFIHINSF